MPTSAPNLHAASFVRPWRNSSAHSSRAPHTDPIPLKAQAKATVEELPDDFYEVQKAGEDLLQKSRRASSGVSLPDTKRALQKFGQATQMAPHQTAPHVGAFAAWRAIHADALGARPFWAKTSAKATCEKSATDMLRELSWIVRQGSVDALSAAIDAPEDLFVGLGHQEGPAELRDNFLPALIGRFDATFCADARLQMKCVKLVHTLLVQQPWAMTHALALVKKMIGLAGGEEQAGQALSQMLFSLGQRRHASPEEWMGLAEALVANCGNFSSVVLPLMPLIRRNLKEAREDQKLYARYIALLVQTGCLGEDRTQVFESVRILTEEAFFLAIGQDAAHREKRSGEEAQSASALSLIKNIQAVCAHAQQMCGPHDRIVAQLGAERLHELSRQAACPKVALAAFSARAALGFGVRPL